jgi:hypothetical protein
MVVFPRDNMFLHKIIAWKFSGVEHDKVLTTSSKNLEEKFGPSFAFVASTFLESGGVPQPANANALLKEAIHVISCGYEDKSDWGKEVSSRKNYIYYNLVAITSPIIYIVQFKFSQKLIWNFESLKVMSIFFNFEVIMFFLQLVTFLQVFKK